MNRQQPTGWEGFGSFAFDRFCRLAIPLLPLMVIFAVIEWLFYGRSHPYPQSFDVRTAAGNLAFLQTLWVDLPFGWQVRPGIEPFGTNRPLWTISVEFWTYVAFGSIYCAWHAKRPRDLSLRLMAGMALLLLGPSLYGSRGSGLPMVWALGALGFHAMKTYRATASTRFVAVVALGVTLALMIKTSTWPSDGDYSANYNLLIFALFMSVVAAASGVKVAQRAMQVAVFFGSFAYTTYLTHYPIVVMIAGTEWLPSDDLTALFVTMLCFPIAWLASLPFEQNYKRIRDVLRFNLGQSAKLLFRGQP